MILLSRLAEPKTMADTYEQTRVRKGLEPFLEEIDDGHIIWHGAYSGKYGVFEHKLVHQILMALEKQTWGRRLYQYPGCPAGCVASAHWYVKDPRPTTVQAMFPRKVLNSDLGRTYRS